MADGGAAVEHPSEGSVAITVCACLSKLWGCRRSLPRRREGKLPASVPAGSHEPELEPGCQHESRPAVPAACPWLPALVFL